MKYKSVIGFTTLIFSFLFLFGCKSETVDNTDQLIGRWDIREAKRNGQATESLDQLYFEFFQDGNMKTNILGADEEATYELDSKVIRQRESQMPIDYTIESISDTSLIMNATINRFNFRFQLGKTVEEE
ncbi:MAG: hypothetical protein KTR30_03455 [Saprospiraceae bacterium]|nr:hypothetical protein [Saprospiraceae bacterium]